MFWWKEKNKDKELLEDFKKQYFQLRNEYWGLIAELDKIERQDEKIESLEWIIGKLSKELEWKTELLTEYHLRFGEECAEIIKNKRLRNNKRISKKGSENCEGVEL